MSDESRGELRGSRRSDIPSAKNIVERVSRKAKGLSSSCESQGPFKVGL